MGEFFILPIIVGFIFLMFRIIKCEFSSIFKLTSATITFLLFIICLSLCIADGWESGSRQKPAIRPEDWPKEIHFVNKTNQSINIIVNFKYTKDELIKKSKINLLFNKIDTIINFKNKDTYTLQTPIMHSDSITEFPIKFNIKITDSLGKVIKQYNKEKFFKSINQSENMNDIFKEHLKQSWILIIM